MRTQPQRLVRLRLLVVVLTLISSVTVIPMSPAAVAAVDCGTPLILPAVADSWIDQNGASNNSGSDASLKIQSKGPSDNYRVLVRFDLAANVPEGCAVETASLRLYADSGDEGRTLQAIRLASDWTETGVTWANQPHTAGEAATTTSGSEWRQWNVTNQVQAMLDSQANYGFLVRDAEESGEGAGQIIYSREKGENPPVLVVRFYPAVPDSTPGEPAEPVAAAVTCGQIIMTSTLLTNSLSECSGDGIVIGADRIIIDLNGQTIDGVGLGAGIRNDGFDGITVRNGSIQEFDYGVLLQFGARGNTIEKLTISLNQISGVELMGARSGNVVRANVLAGNHYGVALRDVTGALVSSNTVEDNGGTGLLLEDASGNVLEANTVVGGGDVGVNLERSTGNTVAGNSVSGNSDGGIDIVDGSHDNLVQGNVITSSGDAGLIVADSHRNIIDSNTSQLMSDSGITLSDANDSVVRGNDVRFNPGGLQIDGSSGNLIERNNASETSGIGIELGDGAFNNLVTRNAANSNGAQGVYVAEDALVGEANVIDQNSAVGNGSDGIVIAKGGHVVTNNLATDNRGWGILAGPGNSGNGNFAVRNSSGQCSGIACTLSDPPPPDTTPPDTSIDSGPATETDDSSAAFTFSSDSDDVSYECALDGAAFVACTTPTGFVGLAVGGHSFAVRAIDISGNIDPTPATYTWTVVPAPPPDTDAPETTIDSAPAATTMETTALIAFSASEQNTTFACSLDGAAFGDCVSPVEYDGLAIGSHSFSVQATDAAGNVDPTPATVTWTIDPPVDSTPPETTIVSGPPPTTTDTTAAIAFMASEEGSSFACSLDGGAFAACTSPVELTQLAIGGHRFSVQATDAAGNSDPTPSELAWEVIVPPDVSAPDTTIDSGPDLATTERTASFTFSASETEVSFWCSLDNATLDQCVSPASYDSLTLGDHSLSVYAVDAAGNADPTPAIYSWTVLAPPDTAQPETTIESGPMLITTETTALFSFGSDDPTATFTCSIDGAPFTNCTSPVEYSDLAPGNHSFAVVATDVAGNIDPTPATHTWAIEEPADVVAPVVTIDSGPAPTTTETTAQVVFSSNEPATFECQLDDVAVAACESPVDYVALALGSHTVSVWATDSAGNRSVAAAYTWTIEPPADVTPPETTIESGPPASTTDTGATFTFSASEQSSTFECSLDGGSYTACSSPVALEGLGAGMHAFAVRARDAAGNVDLTPATYSWEILAPVDCGGPVTILASADAWIDQSNPTRNRGLASDLVVRERGRNQNARVLVRFDQPGQAPEGCVVQSATLQLFASASHTDRSLEVYQVGAAWTELGVTWNNQPATTGSPTTTTSGAGWRQWDVTPSVTSMLESGVNNGFLVKDASEGGSGSRQAFRSRERRDRVPVLVIEYAPTP